MTVYERQDRILAQLDRIAQQEASNNTVAQSHIANLPNVHEWREGVSRDSSDGSVFLHGRNSGQMERILSSKEEKLGKEKARVLENALNSGKPIIYQFWEKLFDVSNLDTLNSVEFPITLEDTAKKIKVVIKRKRTQCVMEIYHNGEEIPTTSTKVQVVSNHRGVQEKQAYRKGLEPTKVLVYNPKGFKTLLVELAKIYKTVVVKDIWAI